LAARFSTAPDSLEGPADAVFPETVGALGVPRSLTISTTAMTKMEIKEPAITTDRGCDMA